MTKENFNSAVAQTGRTIAARILPDKDVLETIEEICQAYNIKYGQISTCIGSLRKINMNYVSSSVFKYTTSMVMEGAFSILAGQGLVSPAEEKDKLNTHLHFVISGQHDAIYGGHVEHGTRTLTTLDLFITELSGLKISRSRDEVTGAVVTSFEEDRSNSLNENRG